MNRRSFLLGLATVPLAGVAVSAPIMGALVVTPVEGPSYSLDELLAGITQENLHGEITAVGIDAGGPGIAVAIVTKRFDANGRVYWEEVHTFTSRDFMDRYREVLREINKRKLPAEGFIMEIEINRR